MKKKFINLLSKINSIQVKLTMNTKFVKGLAMIIQRKLKQKKAPKITLFRRLVRFCFKVSLFPIIPCYFIYNRYLHYLENDPQFLRDYFTERFLNNEKIYEFLYDGKASFDFFKVLDYLLIFKLVPGANIPKEIKERLKCKCSTKEYSYPIGLDVGLDLAGLWTINLSKLGFEYIMVGPLTDINPNYANYNKELIDYNKFKKFLDQPKTEETPKHKIINIDSAVEYLSEAVKNESVIKNVKNLGLEIYFSQTSHTISPHLIEKRFSSYLNRTFEFADSYNIHLYGANDTLSLKYQNPQKLIHQVEAFKRIILRNLAIVASFEHEFIYGMRFGLNSVTDKLRPLSLIMQKKYPQVLVRFRDDIDEDYLKQMLSLLIDTGFVNGILLDAVSDINENDLRRSKADSSKFLGAASLPNSASNKVIHTIRKFVGDEFAIISCGGVFTGEEVFYRLKSGADFVLVNEAFKKRGPYCLEKMVKELSEAMLLKNFKSIQEIKDRGRQIHELEDDYLKYIYKNVEPNLTNESENISGKISDKI